MGLDAGDSKAEGNPGEMAPMSQFYLERLLINIQLTFLYPSPTFFFFFLAEGEMPSLCLLYKEIFLQCIQHTPI